MRAYRPDPNVPAPNCIARGERVPKLLKTGPRIAPPDRARWSEKALPSTHRLRPPLRPPAGGTPTVLRGLATERLPPRHGGPKPKLVATQLMKRPTRGIWVGLGETAAKARYLAERADGLDLVLARIDEFRRGRGYSPSQPIPQLRPRLRAHVGSGMAGGRKTSGRHGPIEAQAMSWIAHYFDPRPADRLLATP